MKPVLQFHSGSREPAVIRSYVGRVTFFPHNGSMAFHNLTQQDAGLYQLYINLQKDAIQSVRLIVMESRRILFHVLTWLSIWNTPSLVIIHIALVSWVVIKGTLTVITGSLYIVSALFLTIIAVMTIPKLHYPSILKCVELTGFKILLEFSQTIVIPTSIIVLKETFGQMNQGCHSRYLSWGTFLASTTVGAVVFSLYFVASHRRIKTPADPVVTGEKTDAA